jgi:hypothetical protein
LDMELSPQLMDGECSLPQPQVSLDVRRGSAHVAWLDRSPVPTSDRESSQKEGSVAHDFNPPRLGFFPFGHVDGQDSILEFSRYLVSVDGDRQFNHP